MMTPLPLSLVAPFKSTWTPTALGQANAWAGDCSGQLEAGWPDPLWRHSDDAAGKQAESGTEAASPRCSS